MRYILWIVQVLLALALGGAGTVKLTTPHDSLVARDGMAWAADFSPGQVQLIGAAEVAGAAGLILPAATGILPVLTPVAAAGLAAIMAGAVWTHVQRGEPFVVPLVLGALCAFVAWGRRRPA